MSFLEDRRARVGAALPLENAILVVSAGDPVPLPEGSDQTYPFRSHAEYFYLAGHECAGGVVAFDPRDGPIDGWVSFVPVVTEAERVWEGRTQIPGAPLTQFTSWLDARRDRPVALLGTPLRNIEFDAVITASIRQALIHARRPKDNHEAALIRRAATATRAGFAKVREMLRPGITERAIQI